MWIKSDDKCIHGLINKKMMKIGPTEQIPSMKAFNDLINKTEIYDTWQQIQYEPYCDKIILSAKPDLYCDFENCHVCDVKQKKQLNHHEFTLKTPLPYVTCIHNYDVPLYIHIIDETKPIQFKIMFVNRSSRSAILHHDSYIFKTMRITRNKIENYDSSLFSYMDVNKMYDFIPYLPDNINKNLIICKEEPSKTDYHIIKIYDICLETMPCQHKVAIQYKNGYNQDIMMFGDNIAKYHWHDLDEKAKAHFKIYLKDIQHINVNSMCLLTRPCKHTVTIVYKDGSTSTNIMSGDHLANQYYWDYLSEHDKKHFQEYKRVKNPCPF